MRIVSLVPSLTLALWDLDAQRHLVGVTKFCVRPPEARAQATVVGGTKDPNLDQIRGLRPDLVLADEDENKPEHLEALATFTRLHVTRIEGVRDVARELEAIGRLVGREHDAEARAQRILEAEQRLRTLTRVFPPVRVFVPIWRKPLMTIGGRTYMSDLVALGGGRNVFATSVRKYFETTFDEARAQDPQAVLLPTEPYRFEARHCAEFASALGLGAAHVRLVDGQAFTWFGTSTEESLRVLPESLAALEPRN